MIKKYNITVEWLDDFIRANKELTQREIQKATHVSTNLISERIKALGLARFTPLTQEQEAYILANIGEHTIQEIADALNISTYKVSKVLNLHPQVKANAQKEKSKIHDPTSTKHKERLMQRKAELEAKLDNCTPDEYYSLAVEYSVLLSNIEANDIITMSAPHASEKIQRTSCIKDVSNVRLQSTLLNQ